MLAGGDPRITTTDYADATRIVTTTTPLDGSRNLTATQMYDSRGRLATTTAPADAGSCTQTTVEHRYLTPVSSEANYGYSFEATSNPYCTTSDATMGWTRTKRDTTGRVVEVASYCGGAAPPPWGANACVTGAATTSYDGFTVAATDAAGAKKRSTLDGLGRLVSVEEDPTGLDFTTTYGYDASASLTSVTQTRTAAGVPASAQSRTFVYDSLGRLTSATNVENNATTYTYDHNGSVTGVQMAGGVSKGYGYNHRNQMVSKTYSDGTPPVTYCYDGTVWVSSCGDATTAITNAKGRLTSVGSSAAVTNYTAYDSLGRVTKSSQSIDGATYQFQYSYLKGGQRSYVKHPGGRELSFDFNNAGQVKSVANGAVAGDCGGGCYATGVGYAATGALDHATFGQLTHTFGYNPQLQLTTIGVARGATPVWSLTNTYSVNQNNGNVSNQAVDATGAGGVAVSTAYRYDVLNRLASSTEVDGSAGTASQTYGYDSVGNDGSARVRCSFRTGRGRARRGSMARRIG